MNEKLIERIRKMLGADSDVTDEQIGEALKGAKFVDLNEGGYISQEKADRLVKAEKDAAEKDRTELADLKAATDGDDGLKRQIATLTDERDKLKGQLVETSGKLTKAERKALVDEKLAHLSPKLRRLAMQDAEELVSETVDFAEALEKTVADDPDYAAPADDADDDETKETSHVKVGGGKAPKGKSTDGGDDAAFEAFEKAVDATLGDDADAKE